jgi:hypothetical protein
VPATAKLTDAEVKKIRRRVRAGAGRSELAREYGVNRKTIKRRLDALELAEAEPGPQGEVGEKLARPLEQAPPRTGRAARGARTEAAPTEAPGAAHASSAARPRRLASIWVGGGGVPLFPDTAEGRAVRLAYYEASELDRLPDSLYDYNDVIRGRETPAERRAREGRTGGRR